MRILNLIYAPIRYASTRYLSQTINHDKNVKKVKSKFIICGKELILGNHLSLATIHLPGRVNFSGYAWKQLFIGILYMGYVD